MANNIEIYRALRAEDTAELDQGFVKPADPTPAFDPAKLGILLDKRTDLALDHPPIADLLQIAQNDDFISGTSSWLNEPLSIDHLVDTKRDCPDSCPAYCTCANIPVEASGFQIILDISSQKPLEDELDPENFLQIKGIPTHNDEELSPRR